MSIELVIFIILAAVAIFSAALMLVTRNAVHSALFLVTNFLCVSFFYLMLNAPFLAMIQVTVYAGAIMVLFMFVIMLLGSERLNEGGGRYAWIAPVAVVLTMIFLFVAFGAVVQGKISLLKPVAHDPQVRFVDVVAGAPAFDVYVGNQKIAGNVGYNAATDFVATPAGDAQALLFPTCTQSQCADPLTSNAAPVLALPLKLAGDTQTTYVIAGTPDQLQLITVPTDLSTVDQDQDIRITAVNALPGSQAITLMRRDPAIVASSDLKAPKPLTPLFDPLKFGEVSKTLALTADDYLLEWQQGSQRISVLPQFTAKGKTSELIILAPEIGAGETTAHPASIRTSPLRTDEGFGSPQQIGQSLLSTFLLPFELVSLLLLVAMVGAIIMTREEVTRRVRERIIVSPGARRLNAAMVPANPRSAGVTNPVNPSESSAD